MRFASLGSGSRGNAWVIESGRSRVLLDCGFSLSATMQRLARFGLDAANLDAILVTHEHTDHAGGVFRLARRYGLTVCLSHGTLSALGDAAAAGCRLQLLHAGEPFALGDLQVEPFTIPHDAREPLQFVFGNGAVRLGFLTDAGHVSAHVEQVLRGCEGLVLESNHDPELLRTGRYHHALKARVAGRHGHLSNDEAAALLSRLAGPHLRQVVAAHLSEENNRPELARAAFAGVLAGAAGDVAIAGQADGLDWRSL